MEAATSKSASISTSTPSSQYPSQPDIALILPYITFKGGLTEGSQQLQQGLEAAALAARRGAPEAALRVVRPDLSRQ